MLFNRYSIVILLVSYLFLSFSPKLIQEEEVSGVFSCYINGKPFVVDGMTASLRKITGGERQLSLYNDRFVKFAFMNPSMRSIDLEKSSVREAYIRYEDPASSATGKPIKGTVTILNLDEEKKVLTGEFEMELSVTVNNATKILKVTNGKFLNIPIVVK